MTEAPRRIHLVGGGGSGKTTLARRIASASRAPLHELDAIGYEGGAGAKRPLDAKLADIAKISAEPAWVTEGIFLWWTDKLLAAADLIIWLDLPWRVAAWRIVTRHIKRSLRGDNPHPGLRRLWRFLGYQRQYHSAASARQPPRARDDDGATTRAATAKALEPHMARVVRCRSAGDVRRLARRLGLG